VSVHLYVCAASSDRILQLNLVDNGFDVVKTPFISYVYYCRVSILEDHKFNKHYSRVWWNIHSVTYIYNTMPVYTSIRV